MATWPASLPQSFLVDGYERARGSGVLRTPTDMGPSKRRRRYSATSDPMGGSMKMTATQKDTFETFVADTLKGGTLAFDFTHPETGVTVSVALVGQNGALYNVRQYGADEWLVRFSLEVLP